MKEKPTVCLIDEDDNIRIGWTKTLDSDATILYFQDHLELLNQAAREPGLIQSLACIITGRYFHHIKLDIVKSNVPNTLKSFSVGPVFLNWQGYITKDEVNAKFDGKLFHRYGVKWQTLRLRIQKFEKTQKHTRKPSYNPAHIGFLDKGLPNNGISKPEKCTELLKLMACRATGQHKEKIEHYAYQDQQTGMQLLEAIYNRLLTDKNRPTSCPSRYINSSPVIAQRILHETLYR